MHTSPNKCVRRKTSSSGELNQAIASTERKGIERNRAGYKLGIFELGALLECATADKLEFFVEDDAFEGGATAERPLFDDFELIGEGHALEGGAALKCALANSFEAFVK